jgi:hypothetical protein
MEGTLMASDPNAPRSRRALLTAAAGAAGAMAASAALPLTAAAADPNDVVKETNNATALTTAITTTSADPVNSPQISFKARTVNKDAAGLLGSTGDETDIATNTSFTGVYGFSEAVPIDVTDAFATGVWGDSLDVGTLGTGFVGVRGEGDIGVVAAGGFGLGTAGLLAWGGDGSGADVAIDVRGRARFSRAKRSTIGAGRSSLKVNLTGVTSASLVLAVLHSNRSGRYVRAVVPTTGSFTIYLNTAVTSATYVAWFVIN